MRPLLLFGIIYLVFAEFVNLGDEVRVLSGRPAQRRDPVHVLRRGDGRGRHVGPGPRGAAAQDPLPAAGDPDRGGAHGRFNLGLNLIVVLVFMLASASSRTGRWLQAPMLDRCARSARARARDAGLGALRPLPRHPADLGRPAADDVLRDAAALPDRDGDRPDRAEAADAQPPRGDRAAVPPRRDRPERARCRRRRGRIRAAGDSDRTRSRVGHHRLLRVPREAPRIAEDL